MHKYLLLLLLPLSMEGQLSKNEKQTKEDTYLGDIAICPGNLRVSSKIGNAGLFCCAEGIAVMKDKKMHIVEEDCMDSMLRKMNYEQRAKYIMNGGTIILNQATNGDYTLRTAANLKGGGPIMASALYWITKICCYTGAIVTTGAVVTGAVASAVATGGVTIAPTAVALGTTATVAIKGALVVGASTVAAPVGVVMTGAAVVNTAVITAAGVGTAAATVGATAAVVGAANTSTVALAAGVAGKVGFFAGVEAACCNAFALGLLFPWF